MMTMWSRMYPKYNLNPKLKDLDSTLRRFNIDLIPMESIVTDGMKDSRIGLDGNQITQKLSIQMHTESSIVGPEMT